jgi:hypothetical protein
MGTKKDGTGELFSLDRMVGFSLALGSLLKVSSIA